MAHVVGVPKRDPCSKCSMPVFLAERTSIGLSIYHRTCLKCARCSSQLTVGNFYETEVDGEFCCETCPDEEEKEKEYKVKRSSIADRLAFFESNQNEQKVLSKSLCDEEKSKSLSYAAGLKYKPNSALRDFVNDKTDNSDDDSLPDLPSSLPPALETSTFMSSSSIVVKLKKTSNDEIDALKVISAEETKDNEAYSNSKANSNAEDSSLPTLDLETTNRLSLVSARLNQFEETKSEVKKQNQEVFLEDPNPNEDKVPETKSEDGSLNFSIIESPEELPPHSTESLKFIEPLSKDSQEDEAIVVIVEKEKEPIKETICEVVDNHSSTNLVNSLDQEVPMKTKDATEDENNCQVSIPHIEVNSESVIIESENETSDPIKECEKEVSKALNDKNEQKVAEENKENIEIVSLKENLEKDDCLSYPEDLNPFQSDDENEDKQESHKKPQTLPRKSNSTSSAKSSLNPFDSSDDEVELDKVKVKPPRPPPPKLSKNPFGSESDDEQSAQSSAVNRTPLPKPRTSTNSTPEPTPRPSLKKNLNTSTPLNNSDVYGSTPSLNRYCDSRGSNNSLASNTSSAIHSRKSRRAPLPPGPVIKELFASNETISSPGSSSSTTPKQGRKKRPAPPPPISSVPKNLDSCPQQTQLSDEEKVLLEGNGTNLEKKQSGRRLIALDMRIINDQSDDICKIEEEDVYRRKIIPLEITSPKANYTQSTRQLEKLKDNKESQNRNRQSLSNFNEDNNDSFLNKSIHGKWKRRKGPAPQLPVPPRKVLQMLPLQEIRHELEIIEVQQQGLEKQGVVLEKMIRERCEGKDGELQEIGDKHQPNTKEVEDLILQLFELVNEKNELFRRQAELMYLRRQHRLEQEQADLEYEIRLLMAQPERNKTDSDKSREESMIARLVEVVQLRNEVIECLEMDRLREAEEDMSIKQQLEIHSARRENDLDPQSGKELSQIKLSKKEKKKQKELKKLGKSKKVDVDKDTDESEMTKEKADKKKKRKFLFLH